MRNKWKIKTLGEACKKGSSNVSLNKIQENEGKYPIYGAKGFIKKVDFYHQDKPYISIIKDGAGVGRVNLQEAKSSVIGTLQYIIPKENVNINFLYYFLLGIDFNKYSCGAAIPHIYFKDYEKEEIKIPSLEEQKQIVKILDEVFESISKSKENAEKNFKNARELFESYLEEIFSNPKKDWEEKKLGEVCELFQGLAINSKTKHLLTEDKTNIPLLRIKDLKNNSVEQYILSKGYPENSYVKKDEIIYTRTGSLGLVFTNREGILHNNSFRVIPNKKLNKKYLMWFLGSKNFKSKIMKLAYRTAQPDITHKLFKEQLIGVPSLQEQKIIVQKLDALSKEIKELEAIYQQKLNDLEELKKSMLQKAFSGELTGK